MAFAAEDKFGMIAIDEENEATLNLDPRYQYKITHTGKGADGTDDATSAISAWLSTLSGTIIADSSVEDEKYELTDGASETLGPGISKLYLVSTTGTGADATLKIVRVGTPTNSY
jgi:hypothetical protein